jgi:preprotein translocase subunit YajC
MGNHIMAAAEAAKSSSSSATSLIFIALVFGGLLLFMFRSSRRRQQNAQNTQRQVANGTRIRTVHGIFGTVVDSDDRTVLVEIAPGVKVKMLRQAIGAIIPDDEPDGVQHTMQDSADSSSEPDQPESDADSDDTSTSSQRSDISR